MTQSHLATYLQRSIWRDQLRTQILADSRRRKGGRIGRYGLAADVARDRQELEQLMQRPEIAHSGVRSRSVDHRKKLAKLKTVLDDRGDGTFRQLEFVESVGIGDRRQARRCDSSGGGSRACAYSSRRRYAGLIQRAEDSVKSSRNADSRSPCRLAEH